MYELTDFGKESIGSRAAPVLRAKAAESGTLLYYAVHLANRLKTALPTGGPLLAAGACLVKYLDITRAHGDVLPPQAIQQLMDAAARFLVLRQSAGIPYKPKMHMMVHLVYQATTFGNPRCLGGTWEDEGLNMQLAVAARTAHAAVWSKRILATFAHGAGPTSIRASRAKCARR